MYLIPVWESRGIRTPCRTTRSPRVTRWLKGLKSCTRRVGGALWKYERARRAEKPKKQGSDKELFLVARVAIKYAGQSHFYRVISVASNALLSNAVWVTCRAYLEDRKKKSKGETRPAKER